MSEFEKIWHDRYMKNMVTVDTLQKLVDAEKLDADTVDDWIDERKELYGF